MKLLPLLLLVLAGGAAVAACPGSSAEAAPALPTGFADQLVVDGLSQPTSLAFLPDGRVLIAEQRTGAVRLVAGGALSGTPVYTVPDLNASGNEQGLLGVTVDPGWPGRPYVYLYFDRTPGSVIYLARFTASGDLSDPASASLTLGDRHDLITDIPDNAPNHNGGTLRFGPDGMLYVSIGEDADRCAAQDTSSLKGVILRLDVSGVPAGGGGPPARSLLAPADNPFPAGGGNARLIYCYGLRNPFRFHVDRFPGRIVIGDVGENTYEEVDVARSGDDLGWPWREGSYVEAVSACPEPGGSGSGSFTGPIGGYDQTSGSQAVIGGPIYRPVSGGSGTFPAEYDGVVFFAEYYDGFVRALRNDGGGWAPLPAVPGQPDATNWATGVQYVGDFLTGPDGAIWYTKQFPGELHRIAYTLSVTGVEGPGARPGPRLRVSPNPFRPGAEAPTVAVEGGGTGTARLEVFDVSGRRVRVLGAALDAAGAAVIRWDGRGAGGRPVSPGIYFLRLATPAGTASARVVRVP